MPPCVLCADGSPGMLEICRTTFKAGGYRVFTVSSGEAALEFLKLRSVNAAVIDDNMPDIGGLELAGKIKSHNQNIVVVMYCGILPEHEQSPNVDSFLSKAKGPIELRKRVALLLQR